MAKLELLLGVRNLGEVTKEHLDQLVKERVPEDEDLDFKQTLYERGDSAKRDLAGDVAALANARGGVIVLGIRDENDTAAELTPVALGGGEEGRIRQVIASHVAPVPAGISVTPVAGDVEGRGFYLVAVPRSPRAPHAVRVNDGLRYPVRSGTTTRYLSESEVAEAYQRRWTGTVERGRRLAEVCEEGLAASRQDDGLMLYMALVPSVPGTMTLSTFSMHGVHEWLSNQPEILIAGYNRFSESYDVRAGIGRVVVFAGAQVNALWSYWQYFQLHTDGSGFAAIKVWYPETGVAQHVTPNELAYSLSNLLARLAGHAVVNCGCAGDAIVTVGMVPVRDGGLGVSLMRTDAARPRPLQRSHSLEDVPPVTNSLSLDEAASGPAGTLRAVRMSCNGLSQAFGIAETAAITATGGVVMPEVAPESRERVRRWCLEAGIPVEQ